MRKLASGGDRAMTPVEARQRAVEVARVIVGEVMRAQGYFIAPEKHRNFAEQVVAAYEAALWQPIETAPRDGTRVLVFAPAAGSEYPANTQRVDRWHNGGWWQMRPAQPYTRWRPLPAKPGDAT